MSAQEQAEEQKNLGNEEFSAKNFAKALEHYSEAIKLDPKNYVYYSNRSAAYGALGQWELAEADAKECVQCNPGFAKGYHRLANAQKQLGKTDEAIATLKAAQTISPESANVPGIKKLMHELSKEKPGGAGQGGRPLPAGVAKELQELQPKFYGIQREVEQIDAKLAAFGREKKRTTLTEKEILELPEGTITYQSIGKMFLQTSPKENLDSLKNEMKTVDDQIASLEARRSYLVRQKTSLEENISELLAQCNTGN